MDGSCRPRTEVEFRERKLRCGPRTEVVSHAIPPHLVKVKINFDEAQKHNMFIWFNKNYNITFPNF